MNKYCLSFDVDHTPVRVSDLPNESIWARTYSARNREREALGDLFELLMEVDRRGLHLERGYDSMFTFLERGLGYDPGSAHRRWMALCAIRKVPEVQEQLKRGGVTLSAVAMTENHLRQVQKLKTVSDHERQGLFRAIQKKTKLEVEDLLAKQRQELGMSSEPRPDRVRRLDAQRTELQFEVGQEVVEKLMRLKELFFHREPGARLEGVLLFSLRTTLRKHDPKERQARRRTRMLDVADVCVEEKADASSLLPRGLSDEPPLLREPSRPVPPRLPYARRNPPEPTADELLHHPAFLHLQKMRRQRPPLGLPMRDRLLDRAGYRCEYRDPRTRERCTQTAALELDHCVPLSRQGPNSAENLQVLCTGHHRRKSLKEVSFMAKW